MHFLSLYEIENYIIKPSLIRRALANKYPSGKPLPSEAEIEQKIITTLKDTIILAKYKYDDNLEDSIFKSGILLSKPAYRNQDNVKREAEEIRNSYEDFTSLDDLLKVGMGKETLSALFKWLNDDCHLNLCKDDILDVLQLDDIPNDMIDLLKKLNSENSIDPSLDILPPFLENETDMNILLQDLADGENLQIEITT